MCKKRRENMNIDIIKIITENAAMGHEDSAEMLDKIKESRLKYKCGQ